MASMNTNIVNMASNSALERIAAFSAFLPNDRIYTLLPGFCDVHVHFREPGFSFKETIQTGCAAAAHGGYTAVCTMPNLSPVPDCIEHLKKQTAIINRDASINVYPYGSLSIGEKGVELSDMAALADSVIAFSDDGRGVMSGSLMREAMLEAKRLGKIVAAHAEDTTLSGNGIIHAGRYAAKHGLSGITSESEWRQLSRDIDLVRETGCAYHACHISCRESIDLIRSAKADGLDVSCETAPHYLLLSDDDLRDDGRFKMKPPIRSESDREALLEGLSDGTVDMIATDHAPHSASEKSAGLAGSAFGVVGLETAFPLLYSCLVKTGIIGLERLTDLMSNNPRRRFGIPTDDGFSVWDLNASETIDPERFLSMGRSTPFAGWMVTGVCKLTVLNGKAVYRA